MDADYLKSFGITFTEAKVYLVISKLTETEIGRVIKITGLHRGTVYNSIESLIEKGFVSFIDREGKRFYKISGKKIFENIISEKQKEANEIKSKLNKLFLDIEKTKDSGKKQEVEVFYGVPAFKNLFLNMFEKCKKSNIEYLFQGRGGEMQDATGEEFYKYTQKLKKSMKIKCRVILDRGTIRHPYHRYVTGDIRYLHSDIKSPVNFWIYENIVLIILFGASPLISIKIKSDLLSDGFKNYFERLWKLARI